MALMEECSELLALEQIYKSKTIASWLTLAAYLFFIILSICWIWNSLCVCVNILLAKIKKQGKVFPVQNKLSIDFLSWCETLTWHSHRELRIPTAICYLAVLLQSFSLFLYRNTASLPWVGNRKKEDSQNNKLIILMAVCSC